MIEYVLLKGVNDRDCDSQALVDLFKDRNVMLNVIPYNPNVRASRVATRVLPWRVLLRSER